jgi:acyl-CoA reductase-like NAD-dependent aldehyde dehydrogenase
MLAERAGQTLKRTVMELGGHNPMVILADADLDYAVRLANYSSFFHQGQMCMNTRKVWIERPLYEEFTARLAERAAALPRGNPLDPGVVIGPLINDAAVEVMNTRITEAVSKGAKIVTGGSHHGRVYEPTVLTDVPHDVEADYEETFGPLLVVQPVDSADEAIEGINKSPYGLTAAVVTADAYRGFDIARKIKSGMAHINAPTVEMVDDAVRAPMGGVRDSGWGRHGKHAWEDLTDTVWVTITRDQVKLPI